MKRAAIIVLVLLLLLAVLPVAMGMMGMAQCPACAPTSPLAALGLCLAVLGTAVIIVAALFGRRLHPDQGQMWSFVLARRIYRPPQLV